MERVWCNDNSHYKMDLLLGDVSAVLDDLGHDEVTLVGHDWGGAVAWSMPLLYPERTLGVIGVCTPYVAFPSTNIMRAMTGGNEELFYMLWFQKPGVAEAVMDPKVHELMEKMLRKSIDPAELLARMKEQEGP